MTKETAWKKQARLKKENIALLNAKRANKEELPTNLTTLSELMEYVTKKLTYVVDRIDDDYILLENWNIIKFKLKTYE